MTDIEITDLPTTVQGHLEGDFPGGVVDLRYRFALDADDRIPVLAIAP